MSLTTKLRRIALNQQGLLRAESFGRGKRAVLRAIERLGYVQIDTISVVERAHHHVLWSRVPNYSPRHLEQLVSERKLFEYWYHAAAFLPMADYRFSLPRMRQLNGERNWFKDGDRKLMHEILARIEAEGPLRARNFEDERASNSGWWDWKPAKQALEQLFMQGELVVSAREGFQKVYDLPERVIPDWVDTHTPSLDEFAAHLIDASLRAHGFATLVSMTYLRKGQQLRESVKQRLQDRVEAGLLVSQPLGKSGAVYIDPELLEARAPRSVAQLRILSPFDNLVIQRQRCREVFAYDYQIECYVPQPERQFGYFCLPLLYRDRLVGRIDCKAHRNSATLEVRSVHIEHAVGEDFEEMMSAALQSFARFNGCEQVDIADARQAAINGTVQIPLA
ncbi:MAG: winged helix-turn-helix domain-containing protein [Gammaproteobacteria bacterium]|nr:winged helix-turn-helix domain-containing protein [Gammaproteobacteria bacterium]